MLFAFGVSSPNLFVDLIRIPSRVGPRPAPNAPPPAASRPGRPTRSKIMVSGQSDARGEGGRGHARDADIGGSGQPHAWVSRNMRSYAAAAELADLDLASARRSPELLPDKIAKGSGPLARSRRRRSCPGGAAERGRVRLPTPAPCQLKRQRLSRPRAPLHAHSRPSTVALAVVRAVTRPA